MKSLKIYCDNKDTWDEVSSWLDTFWSDELQQISKWEPDPEDEGTYGMFCDGAVDDLKDDLEEVFEGRVEAEWDDA